MKKNGKKNPMAPARAFPRSAIGFRNEYLDFQRGIRVGNLQDNQRITRILKLALEERHGESFITERFGRGVFWQWIGFVLRSNREAKPISSKASFGCAKFFLAMDIDDRLFKCGFSVERGMVRPPEGNRKIQLMPDWDWHRLLSSLKTAGVFERELRRLVCREGFAVDAGCWEDRVVFTGKTFPDGAELKKILEDAPPASWAGFQAYYPMTEKDVRDSSGIDLIESVLAVFSEVAPAMNLCMQTRLE
ncbi:MAG TPA: hypothetical protein VLL97_14490 [Acidobacteriota bacterium]|nr:hypothetical protein [Acidobacteriota bacterium]